MTTEAKVGAFVLGCFSLLAFTLIYLINAQLGGTRRSLSHVSPLCRRDRAGRPSSLRGNQRGESDSGSALELGSYQD